MNLTCLRLLLLALVLLSSLVAFADAGKDYYSILGVPKKSDDRQIKRAYKKQAMKWHPDKHQKNKDRATAKFREIAEAYEVLSDPKKRKLYDIGGEDAVKGQPQDNGDARGGGGPDMHQNANFEEFLRRWSGGMPQGQGDPFSFFTQMPGQGGKGGFPGAGNPFAQGSQPKKPTQGGPLFAKSADVREISFQNHEAEIQKLQRAGNVLVLFYTSGGKSCPKLCHKISSAYNDLATTHKKKVPIIAVQCKRRRGHCATFVDRFPAVALYSKTSPQQRILSEGKAASVSELRSSLDRALAGAAKSASTPGVTELTASLFDSNGDPCNGQFCLLLLERGSKVLSARKAIAEAAKALKDDPVKVFIVQADKHANFVEAFGAPAKKGLRGAAAQVLIYRPRRQRYELFEGDILDGKALAEFTSTVINRGAALPHRVVRTPSMQA